MKPVWLIVLLGLAGAAIGALINQSVGWTTDASIVGTWSCAARTDDAELQTELEFKREGALNRTVWLRARSGEHSVAAKIASEDSWRMRGSTLRISHGDLRLLSETGDGQLLPKKIVQGTFDQPFLGMTHHTILALTSARMTFGTGAGPARCERLA